MPAKMEGFARAAAKAAKLGEAERRAMARRLAADLEKDPAHFEPKRLIALGRAGLEIFAVALTAQAAPAASPPEGDDQTAPKGVDVQGWADLRKPERGFITRAIILGICGSGVFIAAVPLARVFFH